MTSLTDLSIKKALFQESPPVVVVVKDVLESAPLVESEEVS
jgi:hypothetical protein